MILSLTNIKKNYGDLSVLNEINININTNEKIGIVGINGVGKTTLANIIFGSITQDEGNITYYEKNLKIAYLLQSKDYILNSINDNIRSINTNKELYHIASTLGLKNFSQWDVNKINNLSGGEKMKLSLANIWNNNADIIILDEPTNHIDFQGIDWLIKEVQRFTGTLIIISHDRYFLDKTVSKIIEIEKGHANVYYGNYSFYRDEKKRRYENQLKQYLTEQKYKKKIEQEINLLTNWANKSHNQARATAIKNGVLKGGKEFYRAKAKKIDKQIKSKIKRLKKMDKEGIKKPKDDKKIYFEFESLTKGSNRVLEFKSISKTYGDTILFKDSSFYINKGERIGIVGQNGCGKSTLIKIILQEETLDNGEFWISKSCKIGYLSQDILDLNENETIMELFSCFNNSNISKVRSMISNIGFSENVLNKKINSLSLGERKKIKLIKLILDGNNFIILDEPANHLDFQSREQLENTLSSYTGTILLVSHDKYMLEKLCNKIIMIKDLKIKRYEQTFNELESKCSEQGLMINNTIACNNSKEELLIIENQLAFLLGKLSLLTPNDPKYINLDKQFNELLKIKKERFK